MTEESTPAGEKSVAQLRAEAAAAQAQAAEAQAAAAQAKAEAALARAAAAEAALAAEAPAQEAPTAEAPDEEAPAAEAPAEGAPTEEAPAEPVAPTGQAATIAAGYATEGAVLALGGLITADGPVPAVQIGVPLAMLNRHGLIAGATGTGKTRTLQVMAEGLSEAGVPVFLTDIKGDLSGLLTPGQSSDGLLQRCTSIGQEFTPTAFPTELYSLGGHGTGAPIRTTVTDFGPLLLAKVLDLNDTQESALTLIVHWADTQGLALLDLKDLRSVVAYLTSEDGKDELKGIGGISTATAGVILRELSALEAQGGDAFFGEPAFEVADLLRTASDGRGVVSTLELPDLQDRPAVFSTFLMWLLAELFAELPEVGDAEKPKLVFFFDEAHLLFKDASKAFLAQVVTTVRLIRSKGVGIVFVTQTPMDVPEDVLGQLGARVQHALRAHTPNDAKDLRATVRTFPTSDYDLEELLTSLGTGEAVVKVLDEHGAPTPVAWTRLRAPASSMAPAPAATLTAAVTASAQSARYAEPVDRESAFELLTARVAAQEKAAAEAKAATAHDSELADMEAQLRRDAARPGGGSSGSSRSRSRAASPTSSVLNSFLRSAGTVLGREITRSLFGTRRRR